MTTTTNTLGSRGEEAAVQYLRRVGMTVVDRNWRTSAGEIDIVALEGTDVVFVEVKTRKTTTTGTPEEAVSASKRRRMSRLARAYLAHAGISNAHVRFDVVAIRVLAEDRALLRHHRAAFVVEE